MTNNKPTTTIELFLVRHGETDWNQQGLCQGHSDIPLNATGIRQAEELRDSIRGERFDICYASPLKRAARTAEIITAGSTPIVHDSLLKERFLGDVEGKPSANFKDQAAASWDYELNTREFNIEPVRDLLGRAKEFLEKIKVTPAQRILIVAHSGIFKALHHAISGSADYTNLRNFRIQNCELKYYRLEKPTST